MTCFLRYPSRYAAVLLACLTSDLAVVAGTEQPAAGVESPFPPGPVAASAAAAETRARAGLHEPLAHRLEEVGPDVPVKVWVFFADKETGSPAVYEGAVRKLTAECNPKTLRRRALRRTRPGLFDIDDLPVALRYLDAVEATGARVHVVSRWLNGVSVSATREQVERIQRLPFVRSLELVRRGGRLEPREGATTLVEQDKSLGSSPTSFYGVAEAQLTQINLIALHDLGFTGAGVVIGALDSGFHRVHPSYNDPSHPLDVIAEYDFVDGDGDTSIEPGDPDGQGTHGTRTLSIMAAYLPDSYVGAAYDASYILCKTEDDTSETPAEEDRFVAGLEFIEANGGDVATSSLDYPSFYPEWQMDGRTAVITKAVNIATANGLHYLNSGGNYNHDDDPGTQTIAEPIDAFQVISVGAVDLAGNIANWSSDGPTADGRVKPEVLARGVNTDVVDVVGDGYGTASGTSFAVPLVAGTVACLVQAHPDWTVDQMRTYLFRSGDYYVAHGTFEPTYVRGYGIIDALAAHGGDCNENGIDDALDIAGPTSTDCDGNGVPDECFMVDCNDNGTADGCDIEGGASLDDDANGIPDECECVPLAAPLPDAPVAAKGRYLSFTSGNPGRRTAVRVTLADLPDGMADLEGLVAWVDHPLTVSERSTLTDATPPTFHAARLTCEPVYRDWSADGTVHVIGDVIVPGATYYVQEIEIACADPFGDETGFSERFVVDTPQWGDVAGFWSTDYWTAPDLDADFDDITAIVDKFRDLPGSVSKTRADLAGATPDFVVDFDDITAIVDGFRGFAYPYTGSDPCP